MVARTVARGGVRHSRSVPPGRKDGKDGGVRDWRADVAKEGATKHRADAVSQVLSIITADTRSEWTDKRQDDAHRAE